MFVEGYDVNGVLKLIDYDEVVCLESIVESMVVFCLVFDLVNGIVIVGIFFVLFDGVLGMLFMLVDCVKEFGLMFCVKICVMVVVGCDVVIMGYGLVLVI